MKSLAFVALVMTILTVAWSLRRDDLDSRSTAAPPIPAGGDSSDGVPSVLLDRPTLPGRHKASPTLADPRASSMVTVRREPQGPKEGIGAYRFRVEWLAAYDAFRAAALLTPEKERALLRILADVQENFAVVDRELDELRSEAARNPSAENERRYNDFLESGIPLLSSVTLESDERVQALLNYDELNEYRRHLWPFHYQLRYGRPLYTGKEPEERVEDMPPHRLGLLWVAAFDAFSRELGGLAPERERAIVTIFADAQDKLALGQMAVSDDVIIAECEVRLKALLNEREWRAYQKHLSGADLYWALQYGQPINIRALEGASSEGNP